MVRPGQDDFDFLRGHWHVRHRRLAARLVGSQDWQEFDGVMTSQPILGGQGNIDDNVLNYPDGPFRAAAVRAFDPGNGQWWIWWLDSRNPTSLGIPLVGGFADGVGTFFADEVIDGRPVRVRFLWTDIATPSPRWQQAFSIDGGATWEMNWAMEFRREE